MTHMSPPLHIHTFGPEDAPVLLALHGVTGHGRRWQPLADTHLPKYRVLAPDLRGHGRSTPLPPWTLEQHAADLLSLIDNCQLDAVPVVAHSFGGAVALHLLRLAPGRVSKLVLLDPAIGLPAALALARASQPQRLFASHQQAREAQRYDWPTIGEEAIAEELAAHLERVGQQWRFRYCAPAVATAWSELARAAVLPRPGTPTLLVRALREQYVSPAFVKGCQLALGDDFSLVEMDCGHMMYLERPEEVAALVTDFVGQG